MVGLIDCDNFFCSCERVFRPDLARTPVVVLSNNDGCVVARSREVKAMGVKEGLPYYQLRQQYGNRGIVAFSSHYSLYGDMSARVMSILRDECPDVMQYSIDEAFLDLAGIDRHHNLKTWGEELCRRIEKWTGIPVSLGIAPTKTLAKIASRFAKRYPAYNKCCLITTDAQRLKALELTAVADVWGIGRRTGPELERLGVKTALDFARLHRNFVRRRFHVTGERTWAELNGEDSIPVDRLDTDTRQTIMTSRSFPAMITDADALRTHVANYAARCAMRLRRQHTVCSMVTTFINSNRFRTDLPQWDGAAHYTFATPTATTGEIVQAATALVDTIFRPGIHYKRAGVMAAGISPDDAVQPDLFTFDPDRSLKLKEVSAAIDRINSRLGPDTITLGAQHHPHPAPPDSIEHDYFEADTTPLNLCFTDIYPSSNPGRRNRWGYI